MKAFRALNQIEETLKQTGLDYEIKVGGRHMKFLLQGQIVAVMPTSGKCPESTAHRRRTLNAIKGIQRIAREKGVNV